jgi:hypothetical protein
MKHAPGTQRVTGFRRLNLDDVGPKFAEHF